MTVAPASARLPAPASARLPAPARPPATVRLFVRKVRFLVAVPHFSHEATAAAAAPAASAQLAAAAAQAASAQLAAATLRALAHEVLPAAVMVSAVMAGHHPAAMVAAALILALLSFAYAPFARTRVWAREHLADLWAMLLLMTFMALTRGESTFPSARNVDLPRVSAQVHEMSSGFGMGGAGAMSGAASAATSATSAATSAAAVAVVVAWAVMRVLLARRGWRIHSLVSVAVCGTGLAWMLVA